MKILSQEKIKKPLWKKWWFWLIIILLIGGIGSAADSGTDSNEVAEAEVSNPSTSVSSEKVKSDVDGTVGQVVQVGDLDFVVNSLDTNSEIGSEYLGQTAKGVYLILNISITNNGNKAAHISDDSFKILSGEAKYSTDSTAGIYANEAGNSAVFSELNPGTTQTTNIVFDVPQSVVDDANAKFKASSLWGAHSALISIH